MDNLEKAKKMLLLKKVNEILARPITPEMLISLKETYMKNGHLPLLYRMAKHLLENNTSEQVIVTLSKDLSLTAEEQGSLERYLSKIQKK